jgi:tmRNA-binding protein
LYDKRQDLAKKDAERTVERALKNKQYNWSVLLIF